MCVVINVVRNKRKTLGVGWHSRCPWSWGERDIGVMEWLSPERSGSALCCAVVNPEAWYILKNMGWKNKFTDISQYCTIFLLICLEIILPEGTWKISQRWWKFLGKKLEGLGARTDRFTPSEWSRTKERGSGSLLCHFCERSGFVFLGHFLRWVHFMQRKKWWKGDWKNSVFIYGQEWGW